MEVLHIKVLKYPDGLYAEMDNASGGYPCPTIHLFNAYRWNARTSEALQKYMESFPELALHSLRITVEEE